MAATNRLMGGAQKSSLPPRKMVDSPIQSEPVSQTIATIPVRPIIINRSGPAPMPMMGGAQTMPPMMGGANAGPSPVGGVQMPIQPPMPPGPPMNTPMPVMPQPGGGGNDFFMQQLMMAAQQGRNGGM